MRRRLSIIVLLIPALSSASCGGTSTVLPSPSNGTPIVDTHVTQPVADASTANDETSEPDQQPTTNTSAVATTEPEPIESGTSEETSDQVDSNEEDSTTITTPPAPTTTFGIVTEEPADVKSGVETWEPDA